MHLTLGWHGSQCTSPLQAKSKNTWQSLTKISKQQLSTAKLLSKHILFIAAYSLDFSAEQTRRVIVLGCVNNRMCYSWLGFIYNVIINIERYFETWFSFQTNTFIKHYWDGIHSVFFSFFGWTVTVGLALWWLMEGTWRDRMSKWWCVYHRSVLGWAAVYWG